MAQGENEEMYVKQKSQSHVSFAEDENNEEFYLDNDEELDMPDEDDGDQERR